MQAKYPYHLLIAHQKLRVHKLIQMSQVTLTVCSRRGSQGLKSGQKVTDIC